jgi:hypothetical protein
LSILRGQIHNGHGGACADPGRPISQPTAIALGFLGLAFISVGFGGVVLTLCRCEVGWSWRRASASLGASVSVLWVGWSLAGHAYGAAFPDPNWCLTENAPASPGLSGASAKRYGRAEDVRVLSAGARPLALGPRI